MSKFAERGDDVRMAHSAVVHFVVFVESLLRTRDLIELNDCVEHAQKKLYWHVGRNEQSVSVSLGILQPLIIQHFGCNNFHPVFIYTFRISARQCDPTSMRQIANCNLAYAFNERVAVIQRVSVRRCGSLKGGNI